MEDKAKILNWNVIINGRIKTRVDEIDKKLKMTFEWRILVMKELNEQFLSPMWSWVNGRYQDKFF